MSYVVKVEEGRIFFYTGSNPELWMQMRQRPGIVANTTVIKFGGPFGDTLHIGGFGTREDAESFRNWLIDTCVHKSTVSVKRAPKAVAP